MKRILAAVESDALQARVARTAAELARALGAELNLCHVMPEADYEEIQSHLELRHERPFSITHAEDWARGGGQAAADALGRPAPHAVGLVGQPADEILELAERIGAELIVLGFEGLHGLGKLRALGSVSRQVMERARCPVVVVPLGRELAATPVATRTALAAYRII